MQMTHYLLDDSTNAIAHTAQINLSAIKALSDALSKDKLHRFVLLLQGEQVPVETRSDISYVRIETNPEGANIATKESEDICKSEHLVDKNYSKLSQYVYVAPDGFNGEVSKYYEPIEELYVEQGQSVKFFAGYSNGHGVFTDETLQRYYNGLLWKIGDNAFNLNSFRYTFNTSGEFDCSLETTDLFGDTLRNNFKVYVNAPNSISLDFPYNKNHLNQVRDPFSGSSPAFYHFFTKKFEFTAVHRHKPDQRFH